MNYSDPTAKKTSKVTFAAVTVCALFLLFSLAQIPANAASAAKKYSAASTSNTSFSDIPTLTKDTKSLSIGKNIYITPDAEGKITPQILQQRYKQNIRGKRQHTDLLRLPMDSPGYWLVFEIKNNSRQEEWILDFGNVQKGRMGFAKKILIENVTSKKVFAKSPYLKIKNIGNGVDSAPSKNFMGATIPVRLQSGKNNLFAIYIEPDKGFPLTFTPRIIHPQTYILSLLNGDISTILAGLFFIIIMAT